MENAQDREGHQRVAAAQPRWPPVGVAAAARHPVDGERGRCLQREPTVRQPFRFEQPQRIRAARIAEAPQLGHHLQGEQHVEELDREVDTFRTRPASPVRDDRVPSPRCHNNRRGQHEVGHPLRRLQGRPVRVRGPVRP